LESYKERHVTWLENFYDLVVAIIVFQLSRSGVSLLRNSKPSYLLLFEYMIMAVMD